MEFRIHSTHLRKKERKTGGRRGRRIGMRGRRGRRGRISVIHCISRHLVSSAFQVQHTLTEFTEVVLFSPPTPLSFLTSRCVQSSLNKGAMKKWANLEGRKDEEEGRREKE